MTSAKVLEFFGWFSIIVAFLGGIVILSEFGKESSVAMAICIAIIIEQVIFGVFFIVVAHIGENVYQIKRRLLREHTKLIEGDKDKGADKRKESYVSDSDKPEEGNKMAKDATTICWNCKNLRVSFWTTKKGKCDVFNENVSSEATCRYFKRIK